jgi:hypothetical protein
VNREAWLSALAVRLAPDFEAVGHVLPVKLAVSVGFPSRGALSVSRQVIGQCWAGEASPDGTVQVFVSPVIADGLRAADVLVHELCHAVLPVGTGHKKPFKKLARKMGLEGKPTATVAGAELVQRLNAHLSHLGPYPHVQLQVAGTLRKQSTRMLKAACECGYTVRLSRQWLEKGAPICPIDGAQMEPR